MLTEDYCDFETAKLLKEKGFPLPATNFEDWVFCMYDKNGNIQWGCYHPDYYARVTLQMACKWLREVHRLHISVDVCPIYGKVKDEKGKNTCGLLYWHYMASGEWINDKYNPRQKAFVVSAKCYEEAVEAALKYCLKNLI